MRRLATAPLVVIFLASCSLGPSSSAPATDEPPAEVVQIEGTERSQVILTADAVERLGIKTDPIRNVAPQGTLTVVPVAALIYDTEGNTWIYINTAPRTYSREAVTVERIDGDNAILQTGPPVGTSVVTVGGAELLGAEYGVEGE